jgi:hypothetical protein
MPDPPKTTIPGRLGAMSKAGPVQLKSPLARAVVPVLGGIAFFVVLALVLWGIAAWISRGGAEVSERLAPPRLEVATVQSAARIVEEEGPIILPGLNTTTGERTLVLDHDGADPTRGWRIYYAYPIGRPDCPVQQVVATGELIDCEGVPISPTELSPPDAGVFPVVENQRVLYIDLAGVTGG